MESDSSLENEETQHGRRDWANVPAQNSDVSDDENFSRGAKSIESPPESPWCGANLDSPPASPAPQRRSPNERRGSSGSISGSEARSPERPQTPDSGPESPRNSLPASPQNSAPTSPHNSAPSSPRSFDNRSPRRNRVRKSRSSSSDKSRSPSSNSERQSSPADKRPRSPLSEQGLRSPSSDKEGPSSPTSDKGRPRTPLSDKDGPRSPSFDKEPQSPTSDKDVRSPSSNKGRRRSPFPNKDRLTDKKRIRSPNIKRSLDRQSRSPGKRSLHSRSRNVNIRKHRNTPDSSDSDTTPVRNSYHSDSDEDDRSSGDYRHRRKSNRDSSLSSVDSRRKHSNNMAKSSKHQGKDLDLSDVSDIDSLGPVSDEDAKHKEKNKAKEDGEKTDLTMIDDSEQLDFEAEETDKLENGDHIAPSSEPDSIKELDDKEREDLEEGELSDEGEARPEETEPRPVCRFFSRGQCTWGSSCSYRHVGEGGTTATVGVAPPATTTKVKQQSPQQGTPSTSTSTTTPTVPAKPVVHGPPQVQHGPPQHGPVHGPIPPHAVPMQHGAPMMHHPPMHHPPRFLPRPHGPPFFRRPLRPMFPRFVHPGVTDKGNYTMFEMVRPLVPMNAGGPMLHGGPHGPPHHHMYPPHMEHPYMRPPHMERPPPPMVRMPPPYQHQQPPPRKEPDSSSESAWERGLRQAKEMIRKSSKRKETDVDFEEKKMTMSGGGEGVDKENEFYTQAPHTGNTSPYEEEHYSRYNKVEERRLSREGYRERGYSEYSGTWPGYEEEESPPHHRQSGHRYPRHHHQGAREHHRGGDYDYYDEREDRERERERDRDHRDRERRKEGRTERSNRKSRTYRDKQSPRDAGAHLDKQPSAYQLSPSEGGEKRRYERNRGSAKSNKRGDDDWADPWMRSKSPGRKARKPSFSSKSSFSSSSSSRTSSYSSYSRSASRSSASGSSRSRSRSLSAQRRSSKKRKPAQRNKSPFSRVADKRSSDVERSLHMNPPAPSPSSTALYSNERRERKEINARLLAAMRKKQRSSSKSSSSGSDSSGSSDDSSSSLSDSHSSSSSRTPSPTPNPSSLRPSRKKVVLDEKLAQAMKVKAMDALKLSGQKQQIKLNLKGKDALSERLQQMPISSSRKRAAESLPFDDGSPPNVKMSKKAVPSRREELLKQLKAVEDAIARKRSKI